MFPKPTKKIDPVEFMLEKEIRGHAGKQKIFDRLRYEINVRPWGARCYIERATVASAGSAIPNGYVVRERATCCLFIRRQSEMQH